MAKTPFYLCNGIYDIHKTTYLLWNCSLDINFVEKMYVQMFSSKKMLLKTLDDIWLLPEIVIPSGLFY